MQFDELQFPFWRDSFRSYGSCSKVSLACFKRVYFVFLNNSLLGRTSKVLETSQAFPVEPYWAMYDDIYK